MTNQNSKIDKKDTKEKEDSAKSGTVQNVEKQNDTDNKYAKKDEIALLKERIEELEEQNKRLLADYRNLEKRVENERIEWVLKANKSLLLNLLPVLDTLMLANKHSQSKDQSISLSVQQFLDILKRENIVKIETLGESFDPNLMECIETVEVDPTEGSGQDGKVTEEVRAGYTLYDKTLRVAQVKVGSAK